MVNVSPRVASHVLRLHVHSPGRLRPIAFCHFALTHLAGGLLTPANAALLENGAAGDFECAFGMYTVAGGLVGNELEVGTTLIVTKEYGARTFNPVSSDYANITCDANGEVGVYIPLSTARWMGDTVAGLLTAWTDAQVPNRQDLLARSAAYSG